LNIEKRFSISGSVFVLKLSLRVQTFKVFETLKVYFFSRRKFLAQIETITPQQARERALERGVKVDSWK
jgi:hypothetical protein